MSEIDNYLPTENDFDNCEYNECGELCYFTKSSHYKEIKEFLMKNREKYVDTYISEYNKRFGKQMTKYDADNKLSWVARRGYQNYMTSIKKRPIISTISAELSQIVNDEYKKKLLKAENECITKCEETNSLYFRIYLEFIQERIELLNLREKK